VWSGVPEGTVTLALIVVDQDAPGGPFCHWLAWDIDPQSTGLAEAEHAPMEGQNDFGTQGYRGPCPPPRHRPHRYFFRLRALDRPLELPADTIRLELRDAMEEHVLGEAELVGTFER
jgi:Raf kinase inhibitor-like YbhB/YbcL family protein